MMRFILKILIVALCSSGHANSSSTLHMELKKLQQLSQEIDVRVPSRSPAIPQQDEVSLSQSAIQRSAFPSNQDKLEDKELMQIDLDSFERQQKSKPKRSSNGPMYRGR